MNDAERGANCRRRPRRAAGGGGPKQYRQLGGAPLLRHTVACFAAHRRIDAIRVVIHADDSELYAQAVSPYALLSPVEGGPTRQDSTRNGLESLADINPANVLIHDAARPFVAPGTIDRVIDAISADTPAVIAGMPVTDTLKRIDATSRVTETVDRTQLFQAQTPQGFRYADILAAHRDAAGRALTDDAAVAEAFGLSVKLVAGDPGNVKLTLAEDFVRAEHQFAAAAGDYRSASGFDVHPFEAGDHVMLCGVKVPHNCGLAGHSDSDVGLHALTDALLGTIGAGDIGSHFPPSDPQWQGADSAVFLRHAARLVGERGGVLRHVDLTLICEAPKIGPHRDAMRARLADILSLDIDRVSVKATTTDGLGFLGRNEGIAAQAMATARFP